MIKMQWITQAVKDKCKKILTITISVSLILLTYPYFPVIAEDNNSSLIAETEYDEIGSEESLTNNYFGGADTYWCNKASGYYLMLDNGTPDSDTLNIPKQQLARENLNAEWAFIFNDSTRTSFTIRPASNLEKCLSPGEARSNYPAEREVNLVDYPTTSAVPDEYLWQAIPIGQTNQYYIQNVGMEGYKLYSYAVGGLCITNGNNHFENYKIWTYSTDVSHLEDSLVSFEIMASSYMDTDNTQTIQIVNVSPTDAPLTSIEYFDFYVENDSIATVDDNGIISTLLDDQNNQMVGSTMVYVKHRPTGVIRYFRLTIGCVVPAGEYYIVNKQTGKF